MSATLVVSRASLALFRARTRHLLPHARGDVEVELGEAQVGEAVDEARIRRRLEHHQPTAQPAARRRHVSRHESRRLSAAGALGRWALGARFFGLCRWRVPAFYRRAVPSQAAPGVQDEHEKAQNCERSAERGKRLE